MEVIPGLWEELLRRAHEIDAVSQACSYGAWREIPELRRTVNSIFSSRWFLREPPPRMKIRAGAPKGLMRPEKSRKVGATWRNPVDTK